MKLNSYINILSLVLLVSLFLFTPFAEFKKVVVLAALFGVWFLSSYSINAKALSKSLPLVAILGVLMLLQYFLSTGSGDSLLFRRFFTQNLWTYIWGVLGVFYAANLNLFKKCILFVAIMLLVSCGFTIAGNIIMPGASRLLAGAESEGSQTYDLIHSMNIGGYDFIYALPYALIPCTLWLKRRLAMRYVDIFLIGTILITLVVGSYFISLILAIIAIVLSASSARNYVTIAIYSGIAILLIMIFKENILQGIIDIGVRIDSQALQRRAQQLLDESYQDAYNAVGDYSRLDRAMNAIHNISLSPLFGRMTGVASGTMPSGHSEMLGFFERFGIFGCFYVYYIYLVFKKIGKNVVTKDMKHLLTICLFLLLLFVTVDTFDVANATGCMVFFFAPCTMLYIESMNKIMGNDLVKR